jgi:hypothetical protein
MSLLARFSVDGSGGRSLLLVVAALFVVLFITIIHGAGRIGMINMMMIIMWYQHFHKPLAPIDYFGQARFVVQFD